ncbi:hypothetical protein KI387_033184, partial [Taxus chinensis]
MIRQAGMMVIVKARMEISMANILVCLWMITSFAEAVKGPYVPAMFVFGDSLADAGNNNYIPHSTARANFTPYGVSFFQHPTGRFTNGRIVFDFIGIITDINAHKCSFCRFFRVNLMSDLTAFPVAATYLGLPFPPPYLEPDAKFIGGINFASGGSGLLDSTGAESSVITMSRQVFQFEHFSYKLMRKHRSGAGKAKSYLGKSLYCITTGGNDVAYYIANSTLQNTTAPQQFVTLLLARFDQYIARLYRRGARKFLVLGVPALGCTPYFRFIAYNSSKGECLQPANQLVVAYNTALMSLVARLNRKLDGANIIQLNSYEYFMDILQNAASY